MLDTAVAGAQEVRSGRIPVHGADAWPKHSVPWSGPSTISWERQLEWQAWLKPQLLRQYSQSCNSNSVVATEAAISEFSKAGIPEEVATKVLKQYQPYLRNIDNKLRPALKLWVKQLGSQQLSACLLEQPRLLLRTPEECSDVYLWLASIGIDAAQLQKRAPRVLARPLAQVQSTVRALQQALQLTDEQLPAFLKRSIFSLIYSRERVSQTLQAVADLLAVPVASEEMRLVVMICHRTLFTLDPATVCQRVSFFCEEFNGGQDAAKAALKQHIYFVSTDVMRSHAAELKAMLGWTDHELDRHVQACPILLTREPVTIRSNFLKLQAHGFTSAQALHVFASVPTAAGYDWNSPCNVEKLQYLQLVLQLAADELASRPNFLGTSLHLKLGPRSEFIYRSRGSDPDMPLALSGCSSYIVLLSDANFAARLNRISASPPLIYNEAFKQHWHQRWLFLRHTMRLSIADISACRALLFASLPNTLAPRWHFLTLLEAAQAGFKAADHLTALASLSDEHFAQAYDMPTAGLVYDMKVMQCHLN